MQRGKTLALLKIHRKELRRFRFRELYIFDSVARNEDTS